MIYNLMDDKKVFIAEKKNSILLKEQFFSYVYKKTSFL